MGDFCVFMKMYYEGFALLVLREWHLERKLDWCIVLWNPSFLFFFKIFSMESLFSMKTFDESSFSFTLFSSLHAERRLLYSLEEIQ